MTATLSKTPLHDWHAAHGGRMVDFACWSMPVQYGSIVAEHQATRNAVGLFDVSHMGRFRFTGSGAASCLDSLVSRRVDDMPPGQVRYGLLTNDIGGVIDDVLVYHVPASSDLSVAGGPSGPYYLMVVNASNREKAWGWIEIKFCNRPDVQVEDVTFALAMIAVQGPKAEEVLQPLVATNLKDLKYYHGTQTRIDGQAGIVSRTGYTGEDGFELMVAADAATPLWERILSAGQGVGAIACGLGCRDTLRLEAGMPLYGHELNEETTPLQAGLGFAVNLENRTFPGREALVKMKQIPPQRVRVGLELDGKRVPREHYPILADGKPVGEVTSGTFSPTLNRPIAMGYVDRAHSTPGDQLMIDIRGQQEPARVVKLPFYHRKK